MWDIQFKFSIIKWNLKIIPQNKKDSSYPHQRRESKITNGSPKKNKINQ